MAMIPMLVLLMAGLVSSSVICLDGTQCSEKNTCCLTDRGYACCPYPNAVCCSDKAHCCPEDYHCDHQTQHCVKKELTWSSFRMSPQDPCCLSETGCCPQGLHCDEERRTCVNDFEKVTPVVPLKQASDSQVQAGVIRCNGRFYCPPAHTCCKTPAEQWGCCPYRLGQCCKDGKHCCEYGYTCDSTSSQCTQGYISIPARPKEKALLL
ncbi:hypothetical protein NFI96_014037 [Prochilodus magdalenae]|nr:hypothetical protein NFI96_014037 [Prochilodus magdalenae]